MSDQIDVFISYKREDRAIVDRIATVLRDIDLKVWYDASLAGGEDWANRIERHVNAARAVVVCWSPLAEQSEWVRREAEIAIWRNVAVPVRLADCDLPTWLSRLHAVDLRHWQGDLSDPNLLTLARGLETHVGKPVASFLTERAGGQSPEAVTALRTLLIGIAAAGKSPISYMEALRRIAPAFRHGAKTSLRTLYGTLDAVAEQNRSRREPPLFCLVVNSETGIPGKGYFEKHCFLDHRSPLAEPLFRAQLGEVYRFWNG